MSRLNIININIIISLLLARSCFMLTNFDLNSDKIIVTLIKLFFLQLTALVKNTNNSLTIILATLL